MVLAVSLYLALAVQQKEPPSWLETAAIKKPSMKNVVAYTIPPPKGSTVHSIKVKFPKTIHKGDEDWVFEGQFGGILSVRVEEEGEGAKEPVLQEIIQISVDQADKKDISDVLVSMPWFGKGDPYTFQTTKDREGEMYLLNCISPYVVVSMLASWPAGNTGAKEEALKMATYFIATAESTAPKSKEPPKKKPEPVHKKKAPAS